MNSSKKQVIAISAFFLILGAAFATWASRIPAIRHISALVPATLGYALLAKGIGTVVIMPAVALFLDRFGVKRSALFFGSAVALTLIPMTISPDWIILSLVLFLAGIAAGGFNVSINALASKLEMETGRSYMSLVHSFFGVGVLLGALTGTLLAGLKISANVHFFGMALLLLLILGVGYKYLPEEVPDSIKQRTGLKIPEGSVLWLGFLCFLAASIEDSITNWVAIFYTDHLGVSEGMAPVGYVAYAVSLLLMRFFGDRLKPKYGANTLISAGSILAASGIMLALMTTNIIVATIGFIGAGLGVALTFPMIFSAAGRKGSVALASVITMGAIGGMLSQPVMGLLVENFKLLGGFMFICICMLAVGAGSWKTELLTK
ncbi:MAG: MFS transporter [Gracilimonas sp.]|nr:MFS transporter [Gracilimonas sp.]